jgi:hypothetical protein
MQEEPLSPLQSIIQGDSNRQITLPSDLIHRGLELARRIQNPQEIRNLQPQTSREFLVRCRQIKLKVVEKKDDGLNNANLLLGDLIDLIVSISPEGMTFSKIVPEQQLNFTPIWNESVYAWLKSLAIGDPPCIPTSDYELFYYLYRDEHGKTIIELIPSEKLSYSGPITRGDPKHMVAISIFLIRGELPMILQLFPMDKRCVANLEALQALAENIKKVKKYIP